MLVYSEFWSHYIRISYNCINGYYVIQIIHDIYLFHINLHIVSDGSIMANRFLPSADLQVFGSTRLSTMVYDMLGS